MTFFEIMTSFWGDVRQNVLGALAVVSWEPLAQAGIGGPQLPVNGARFSRMGEWLRGTSMFKYSRITSTDSSHAYVYSEGCQYVFP